MDTVLSILFLGCGTCVGLANDRCDFERLDAKGLTRKKFTAIIQRETPLILENFGGFTAKRENFTKAAFVAAFSNVTSYKIFLPAVQAAVKTTASKSTLGQYLANMGTSGKTYYKFHQCNMDPQCMKIFLETYGMPDAFRGMADEVFIGAGGMSGGIPLHTHGAGWAYAAAGEKLWFLAAPGEPPLEANVNHEVSTLQETEGILQCTQKEAELIIVPPGWWHATHVSSEWALALVGQGSTPGSMYAAARGDVEALEKAGAAILKETAKQSQGWKAIHFAAHGGHVDAVRYLLDIRASANEKSKVFPKPTVLSVSTEAPAVVKLLLERRANPRLTSGSGETPIHLASYHGEYESVKLLLEYRAKLNVKNSEGNTPVSYAAQNLQLEALQLLLESGVKVGPNVMEMIKDLSDDDEQQYKDEYKEVLGVLMSHQAAKKRVDL